MIVEAFRKLKFNPDEKGLVLNVPEEIQEEIIEEGLKFDFNCDNDKKYSFILSFFHSSLDVEQYGVSALNHITEGGMLWLAYPKKSSKLFVDLTRDSGWRLILEAGWVGVAMVAIDDDWSAMRYIRTEDVGKKYAKKSSPKIVKASQATMLEAPEDLLLAVSKNADAQSTFDHLAPSYRKLYINWIMSAKREETRLKRIEEAVIKLIDGQKDPNNNSIKKC